MIVLLNTVRKKEAGLVGKAVVEQATLGDDVLDSVLSATELQECDSIVSRSIRLQRAGAMERRTDTA